MADFEPGSMDIEEQEKTFEGFLTWMKVSTIVTFIVLIFLAIFRT